jgi:ribosome biogenesis protein MAK21
MGKPRPDTGGEVAPDGALLSDVRAFAAELGLSAPGGGGGGGGGGGFDDFAPERAAKRIGKPAPAAKAPKAPKAPAGPKPPPRPAPHPAPPPRAHDFAPPAARPAGGARARSLLAGAAGAWWELADAVAVPRPPAGAPPPPAHLVDVKRAAGEALLAAEAAAAEAGGSADARWRQQAQRAGTTSDRVAALALAVQEAPAANLKALASLQAMAVKRGGARAVVGAALDALRELWLEALLPPSRKLRFLAAQPLAGLAALPAKEADRALLLWALEDALKSLYAAFLESLDSLSRDALGFVKDRALRSAADLLAGRPEGEGALLPILVNKLGDPDRKLASKAGYLLGCLLAAHPGMKGVAVREVERFVFRPGLADRARYYAVVYLNQLVLSRRDLAPGGPVGGGVIGGAGGQGKGAHGNANGSGSSVKPAAAPPAQQSLARRLVDLYFTLFKLTLDGKVGTAASLAAGAKERAAAGAAADAARKGRKRPTKAALRAAEAAATASAAAATAAAGGEVDARMLGALLAGVRRAFPFVEPAEVEPLVAAHADAIFRLVHTRSLGVAAQALLLLQQLMAGRDAVSDRFYRALYAVLSSPELPRSTKAPLLLGLVFRALKADVSPPRVAAFAKRLLQAAAGGPPGFACGALLLLSELMRARPALWAGVQQAEERAAVGGAPEVAPADGGSSSDDGDEGGGAAQAAAKKAAAASGAWPGPDGYDARARDPRHARAERAALWELLPLAAHAHPSAAAMARTLLAGAHVSYAGDPLRELTLGAFLDKFIARKPKAGAPRGDSAMQPLGGAAAGAAAGGVAGGVAGAAAAAAAAAAAGARGAALAAAAAAEPAPDDAFFHKFYSMGRVQAAAAAAKAARARRAGRADAPADGEEELVSDADSDGGDSDGALDAFLEAEEDGGEGGVGADPDAATRGFDYAGLAAAMESDGEGGSESGEEGSESDGEEASEGGSGGSGSQEEEGASGSDGGASLEGEEFSGLSGGSGSGGEESGEEEGGGGGGGDGSDDSGEDDEALEGEEEESGSDGDDSLLRSPSDLSGASGGSSSDENEDDGADDAAADAEVAALLAALPRLAAAARPKRGRAAAAAAAEDDSSEGEGVNPFELAEATDSEAEEAGPSPGSESDSESNSESRPSSDGSGSDLDMSDGFGDDASSSEEEAAAAPAPGGRAAAKRARRELPLFAAAEDYAEAIESDLAAEAAAAAAGAGEEEEAPRGRGARRGRGAGRGAAPARAPAKRQRR